MVLFLKIINTLIKAIILNIGRKNLFLCNGKLNIGFSIKISTTLPYKKKKNTQNDAIIEDSIFSLVIKVNTQKISPAKPKAIISTIKNILKGTSFTLIE